MSTAADVRVVIGAGRTPTAEPGAEAISGQRPARHRVRVVALSDQHGYLPDIPDCDLLLIAGDICPVTNHHVDFQLRWLQTEFAEWLESVPAKKVVGVAGNHDFIFERPDYQPKLAGLPWIYARDSSVECYGLKIYGTPWQRWFFDWAFNAPRGDDDERFLTERFGRIPNDTDILVSHGPPYCHGDLTDRGVHAGSRALLDRIRVVQPRLCVYGHIHEAPGEWRIGETLAANVTVVNLDYALTDGPRVFDL